MTNYYYFVPSLPALKSDSSSFMSVDDFLALCSTHISKKDYCMLERVAHSNDVVRGNSFTEGYTRFRRQVEDELAWQRSRALKLDESKYKPEEESSESVRQAVHKAVFQADPLEGEKILLSLYFDYLDRHISFGHEYDVTFLISYALKLDLLARRNSFSQDKGRKVFEGLADEIRKEIFK